MIESLDDALDALIREVASPLAANLGETVQATEWGLRTSLIALVETLQRQSADYQFFDSVIELADHYRRTNVDGTAETYFSPASIAAGNSLVEGVFGANRANLTEEISRAASLQPHAAVCVLNVAAVLLLKSLEPDVSQEKLKETSSRSERSRGCFASLASAAVWRARIHGGQVNERRGAGQKENTKCEALLVLARGGNDLDRRLNMVLWS